MIPDLMYSEVILRAKMEDCPLFPLLCEEMKELLPEAYFGGMEVPAYLHINIGSGSSIEDIIATICSIGDGANSSGYIDNKGIHFHLPEDDLIQVDLSKDFVFVSQPHVVGGEVPTAWQIFRFLQEPVNKALFVAQGRASLVQKSERTFTLCKTLDQLWAEDKMQSLRMEMVESPDAQERGLSKMMEIYEKNTFGSSSSMWEFWDTFGSLLMTRSLGLVLQTFLPTGQDFKCQ